MAHSVSFAYQPINYLTAKNLINSDRSIVRDFTIVG
jgi:hypothetical protein